MKYIFLDIDNSLYNYKIKNISESTMIAFKRARAAGHKIFICTNNLVDDLKKMLNNEVDGFVLASGAIAYCGEKRVLNQELAVDKIQSLTKSLEALKMGYCLIGEFNRYCNERGRLQTERYCGYGELDLNYKKTTAKGYRNIADWDNQTPIYKIDIIGDNYLKQSKIAEIISAEFQNKFIYENSQLPLYINEIVQKDTNITTGLKAILNYNGASLYDTVVISDCNYNQALLELCDIKIAMGNNCSNLKALADFQTSEFIEDGIYNAFKEFNLLG